MTIMVLMTFIFAFDKPATSNDAKHSTPDRGPIDPNPKTITTVTDDRILASRSTTIHNLYSALNSVQSRDTEALMASG